MLAACVATSLSIVREKERETMEQLMVSPLKPEELILGKTLPYVFVCLATMGMVLHTSCVEGCEETDVDRAIRDGRKGHGVPYSLPLDEFVEDTTGRVQCTP